MALDHGCEVVSLDRDVARFERLRWRRPGGSRRPVDGVTASRRSQSLLQRWCD
ncbi:MAG TPA: hypothetical protein VFZ79_08910 [Acidimicrobiales bacterium]